jgi:FlaG/FlaF family flagellin (archaellin)
MHNIPPDDSALSPVIGEMMMIALALLLVSIFSITLLGLLPAERGDSIDIMMNYSSSGDTLQLWHKGGDWVKKSDLKVIIIRGKTSNPLDFELDGDSFDLGDNITLKNINVDGTGLEEGDIVRLINDKNVIYSGTIR